MLRMMWIRDWGKCRWKVTMERRMPLVSLRDRVRVRSVIPVLESSGTGPMTASARWISSWHPGQLVEVSVSWVRQ